MNGPPAPRRTIYQTEGAHSAGRRRRRLRAAALILALVVIAGAVGAGLLLLGRGDDSGAATAPAATSSPSSSAPAVRAAALSDLRVHRGEKAAVGFKVLGAPPGSSWSVTLLVYDLDGTRVKTKRIAGDAPAGRRGSAAVVVDLPAGRYTYSLALAEAGSAANPSDASPAGEASPAGSVPAGAGAVAGTARLRVLAPVPPGFPGSKAVKTALDWAVGRSTPVGVAVVDTNGHYAGGTAAHRRFQAASLAKAILLVASLRDDPSPDAATKATLTTMIEESDNGCAYTIFDRVGRKGMQEVAKLTGMSDYKQGSSWIDTELSAADAARLFYGLEDLVPQDGRGLARELLAGITQMQRWGIPAAAGPAGWKTYFKSGWLGLDNKLMVQAAWLEKGDRRWALAVMTDDNPDRSYGWDTEKGVTGLLLGREPTPAYLATVLEY